MNHLISGAVLINKPGGITSHDVVAKVRRILQNKRVGHTGTLDPFATGLMIICIGPCTRLSKFLTSENKSYKATVRFGLATDTQDITGKFISKFISPVDLTETSLLKALEKFTGLQEQIPPMFSAKKINGEPLHKLARQGKIIFRATNQIQIHSIKVLPRNSGTILTTLPDGTIEVDIDVSCSSGTYIRTLAHDIGKYLSCGAYLASLQRTSVGNFQIDSAITIEELYDFCQESNIEKHILKPIELLENWPRIQIKKDDQVKFCHGQTLSTGGYDSQLLQKVANFLVAVCDEETNLIGIASLDSKTNIISPQIVLAQPSNSNSILTNV